MSVLTSGEHLIKDKVDRKLLNIGSKLLVCFVSGGKWNEKSVEKTDESGWFVKEKSKQRRLICSSSGKLKGNYWNNVEVAIN